MDGIFAGGDMTEGPSTVIQAVASAQKGIEAIEKFLNAGQEQDEETGGIPHYVESVYQEINRSEIKESSAMERLKGIEAEDVQGLNFGQVQTEAQRCLNCGCLAVGASDLAVALVALQATIVTNKRSLSAQAFFKASVANSTVLEMGELIKEIRFPGLPETARQHYMKFTLREPIDFAIVSVASVIQKKNGMCSDARIVLGGVGPAPVRAVEAEAIMKGRPLDDNTASEAAQAALVAARPLKMNEYKVAIARTLVKRSILGVSC